jgi:hypothetical protein
LSEKRRCEKARSDKLELKGWYWKAGSGCLPLLPGRRMSGNRKLSGKICSSHRIQQFSSHGVLRHYNNKIYREYHNYDAADQVLARLIRGSISPCSDVV